MNGVLVIDKPKGWTSHKVVAWVRNALGLRKVGHGGTLDPLATGVLPIYLGEGTKLVPFNLEGIKEYIATMKLGQETDTLDAALGKVRVCSHCLSRSVDSVAAGQHATLMEYSIAHVPAGGFAAPYAIGQVKTSEGMTLFAPLDGDVEGLKPGAPLRFVTVPRDGGAVGFAYTAGR